MPLYNNPYLQNSGTGGYYGQAYSGYAPQPMAQQSYAQPMQMPTYKVMEYVDGEIGAIAYQLPPGWPPNTFFPLWDNKDSVIYLKSINQMGAPNPIQRARFYIEENPTKNLPGSSDTSGANGPDMSQYVTKADFEQLRQEIQRMGNQNGNNNRNNRNDNRGGENK